MLNLSEIRHSILTTQWLQR